MSRLFRSLLVFLIKVNSLRWSDRRLLGDLIHVTIASIGLIAYGAWIAAHLLIGWLLLAVILVGVAFTVRGFLRRFIPAYQGIELSVVQEEMLYNFTR